MNIGRYENSNVAAKIRNIVATILRDELFEDITRFCERYSEEEDDFIKPDYRSKGYARVLMNEMLDRSRKLGFKEVTFTTKPEVMSIGYGLYKRMGFEEMNCIDGVASMRMIL